MWWSITASGATGDGSVTFRGTFCSTDVPVPPLFHGLMFDLTCETVKHLSSVGQTKSKIEMSHDHGQHNWWQQVCVYFQAWGQINVFCILKDVA